MKYLLFLTFSAMTLFANHNEDFPKSTLNGIEAPAAKVVRVCFSYPDIRSIGVEQVLTGPGVCFNRAYPWNWMMHHSNESYITVVVNLTAEEAGQDWYLNVKELSSISGYNCSPISVDVNGTYIVDHFEPQRDAWRIDHFKISQNLLKEGQNKISLHLQEALTNYWIEHLILSPKQPETVWLFDDNLKNHEESKP